MGPTVCEDEGPMPILNKSKTLNAMVSCQALADQAATGKRQRSARMSLTGPSPGSKAFSEVVNAMAGLPGGEMGELN
jgi:hypothetical protein